MTARSFVSVTPDVTRCSAGAWHDSAQAASGHTDSPTVVWCGLSRAAGRSAPPGARSPWRRTARPATCSRITIDRAWLAGRQDVGEPDAGQVGEGEEQQVEEPARSPSPSGSIDPGDQDRDRQVDVGEAPGDDGERGADARRARRWSPGRRGRGTGSGCRRRRSRTARAAARWSASPSPGPERRLEDGHQQRRGAQATAITVRAGCCAPPRARGRRPPSRSRRDRRSDRELSRNG